MDVTTTSDVSSEDELARLVREARDEDAAVADLQGCLARLQRARAAQTRLAGLPAEQLRTVLAARRNELQAGPA